MDLRYDTIENNQLVVTIEKPGVIYKGSRFDWTGHVTSLVYRNRYEFCQPESLVIGEGSGGIGFCNEFGMKSPVGFQEIHPGELYPKIGIGLLKKPTDVPSVQKTPDFVAPFQMKVSSSQDRIRYSMYGSTLSGYSFQLEKQLILYENTLIFDLKLTNNGHKPIDTTEYSHNFIAINHLPIGPEYVLEMPVPVNFTKNAHLFQQTENQLNILQRIGEEFYGKGILPISPLHEAKWTLKNIAAGVSITEQLDAQLFGFALWGKGHVISPELFVKVLVLPGQTQQWKRTYTFSEMI